MLPFRYSIAVLLGIAACGQVVTGQHTPDAATDGSGGSPLVECKAQRVVHIVAGNGGMAWFTLEWPLPAVINNFSATFAYDNPASATNVATAAGHPLFARKIGTRGLWVGTGQDPQPTAILAGVNETHTNSPSSIVVNSGGTGLDAAGSVVQSPLAATFSAIIIGNAGPFGTATGVQPPVAVQNVDGAIGAFQGSIPAEIQQQLHPTAAQIARYAPASASAPELAFASNLAFAANAFKLGVLAMVVMPAYNDDPHGAFDGGTATGRANDLAMALDAFYSDLATANEQTCGHAGQKLSLADNVVMIVEGDTPKDSFTASGWPDGTIGNSNWIYVRSNGFLQPGWFGQITQAARTSFDPNGGALDASANAAADTAAAWAGALYAIARGDKTAVTAVTPAPFNGLILH